MFGSRSIWRIPDSNPVLRPGAVENNPYLMNDFNYLTAEKPRSLNTIFYPIGQSSTNYYYQQVSSWPSNCRGYVQFGTNNIIR